MLWMYKSKDFAREDDVVKFLNIDAEIQPLSITTKPGIHEDKPYILFYREPSGSDNQILSTFDEWCEKITEDCDSDNVVYKMPADEHAPEVYESTVTAPTYPIC